MDLQCCNCCHLLSDFSPRFQSSMTIFHHNFLGMQNLPNLVSIVGKDFMHTPHLQTTTYTCMI